MLRLALPQKILHSHELWLCGIETVYVTQLCGGRVGLLHPCNVVLA